MKTQPPPSSLKAAKPKQLQPNPNAREISQVRQSEPPPLKSYSYPLPLTPALFQDEKYESHPGGGGEAQEEVNPPQGGKLPSASRTYTIHMDGGSC
eukprot:scaffold221841_cov28-Tisochrysis_lutea.AAC.7